MTKDKQSGYYRDQDDFYMEEPWVSARLLDVERILPRSHVHDPCCGQGSIMESFWMNYEEVIVSCSDKHLRLDLLEKDHILYSLYEDGYYYQRDFLQDSHPVLDNVDVFIFNPPYRKTVDFINRAYELCNHKVCALVRLDFMASLERHELNKTASRWWVLSRRPSMPPGKLYMEGKAEAKGGQHDYCWVVFDKLNKGKGEIGFLK